MGIDGKVIFFHDYEERLSGEGLVTCQSLATGKGRLLKRERGQILSLLTPTGEDALLVLKRYFPETHRPAPSRAREDCDRLQAWKARGLPVPDCAALAVEGEGRDAYLLMALASGSRLLDDCLQQVSPREGDRLFMAAARELAGIHVLGMRLPSLSSSSISVAPDGALSFLDPAWRCQQQVGERTVLPDMAHLFSSLEDRHLTRSRKLRFLKAHARVLGREADRPWIKQGWLRLKQLEKRARKKGILPRSIQVVSAGRDPERWDTNLELEATLKGLGFSQPADYLDPGDRAILLRDRGDRRNYRIEGGGKSFFLKVHGRGCEGAGPSPGAREWKNHLRFMKRGIPCPTPAAWGEGIGFSFFLSLASPGLPADDPGMGWAAMDRPRRRRLLRDMACRVASLHEAGLYHRDLYLCHLLVHEEAITFIDLQRVADCPFFSGHRRVKDLAALLYSAQTTPLSFVDKIFFFRHYQGKGQNRSAAKRLIRAVARKAKRIMAHDLKHSERRPGKGSTDEMAPD